MSEVVRTSIRQSERLREAGVMVRTDSGELAWHEFEGTEYQSWVSRPTLDELVETMEAKRQDVIVESDEGQFFVRWTDKTPQRAVDMDNQRSAEFTTMQKVLDFIADLISEKAEKTR